MHPTSDARPAAQVSAIMLLFAAVQGAPQNRRARGAFIDDGFFHMNGVLLLDSRSGRLLFSKAFSVRFGLVDVAAAAEPSLLAALVFALLTNLDDEDDEVKQWTPSSSPKHSLMHIRSLMIRVLL